MFEFVFDRHMPINDTMVLTFRLHASLSTKVRKCIFMPPTHFFFSDFNFFRHLYLIQVGGSPPTCPTSVVTSKKRKEKKERKKWVGHWPTRFRRQWCCVYIHKSLHYETLV